MSTLAELGLTTDDAPIMLITPPDDVLAEASRMRPRPSVATSLLVAEPTARIAWWTSRELLQPGNLERLRWIVSGTQDGVAWLILDPEDDEPVSETALHTLIAGTGLRAAAAALLSSGELAVPLSATG
ncbi:MAG TPA: hypothetical protein VFK32_09830 [Tepidiformaceae bacterium]|nr:hypothetical protein [Tepidiformaceae bacterium]